MACNIEVMKSKDLQLRLLYPARFSLKIEGERIRNFSEKKKKFVTTKLVLLEMLKGLL